MISLFSLPPCAARHMKLMNDDDEATALDRMKMADPES